MFANASSIPFYSCKLFFVGMTTNSVSLSLPPIIAEKTFRRSIFRPKFWRETKPSRAFFHSSASGGVSSSSPPSRARWAVGGGSGGLGARPGRFARPDIISIRLRRCILRVLTNVGISIGVVSRYESESQIGRPSKILLTSIHKNSNKKKVGRFSVRKGMHLSKQKSVYVPRASTTVRT